MKKQYKHYLFDLDDTLLDFKASELLSFSRTLETFGANEQVEQLFELYQVENALLWKNFEKGLVNKDFLKVERFRKIFEAFNLDIDPTMASQRYLETLPETVVLMDHAIEICEWLSGHGEIGIITNGIHQVQMKRIENSNLLPYISFICVSEECGHAKPDVRFFEYAATLSKGLNKAESLVIGDRYDADIVGAKNFGVDSCWMNPSGLKQENPFQKYEIKQLIEMKNIIGQ